MNLPHAKPSNTKFWFLFKACIQQIVIGHANWDERLEMHFPPKSTSTMKKHAQLTWQVLDLGLSPGRGCAAASEQRLRIQCRQRRQKFLLQTSAESGTEG